MIPGLDINIYMSQEGRHDGEEEEIPGSKKTKQLRAQQSIKRSIRKKRAIVIVISERKQLGQTDSTGRWSNGKI